MEGVEDIHGYMWSDMEIEGRIDTVRERGKEMGMDIGETRNRETDEIIGKEKQGERE